jgi:hypothetical protein
MTIRSASSSCSPCGRAPSTPRGCRPIAPGDERQRLAEQRVALTTRTA